MGVVGYRFKGTGLETLVSVRGLGGVTILPGHTILSKAHCLITVTDILVYYSSLHSSRSARVRTLILLSFFFLVCLDW